MQALIISYLVQRKECNLPLLGHFRIKTKPADFDKYNRQIFPPTDEILYSEFAANLSADLITYVSFCQNITLGKAEQEINRWCNNAREKLDLGEKIIFNSIGSLQKDAVGNIFFQRKNQFTFYESVSPENFHKNGEHFVQPAERGTASTVVNKFYRQEPVKRKIWWKIGAIGLAGVSFLILFFYFYTHGFSQAALGGRTSFPVQDPPILHHAP